MDRITEQSQRYMRGELTARELRSSLIAQLSMLNDVETTRLAATIMKGQRNAD